MFRALLLLFLSTSFLFGQSFPDKDYKLQITAKYSGEEVILINSELLISESGEVRWEMPYMYNSASMSGEIEGFSKIGNEIIVNFNFSDNPWGHKGLIRLNLDKNFFQFSEPSIDYTSRQRKGTYYFNEIIDKGENIAIIGEFDCFKGELSSRAGSVPLNQESLPLTPFIFENNTLQYTNRKGNTLLKFMNVSGISNNYKGDVYSDGIKLGTFELSESVLKIDLDSGEGISAIYCFKPSQKYIEKQKREKEIKDLEEKERERLLKLAREKEQKEKLEDFKNISLSRYNVRKNNIDSAIIYWGNLHETNSYSTFKDSMYSLISSNEKGNDIILLNVEETQNFISSNKNALLSFSKELLNDTSVTISFDNSGNCSHKDFKLNQKIFKTYNGLKTFQKTNVKLTFGFAKAKNSKNPVQYITGSTKPIAKTPNGKKYYKATFLSYSYLFGHEIIESKYDQTLEKNMLKIKIPYIKSVTINNTKIGEFEVLEESNQKLNPRILKKTVRSISAIFWLGILTIYSLAA